MGVMHTDYVWWLTAIHGMLLLYLMCVSPDRLKLLLKMSQHSSMPRKIFKRNFHFPRAKRYIYHELLHTLHKRLF